MPKVSEEHRSARRDQIVDAMLRCVARDGFHRTTMTAVVAESGLSAGAVYLYFTSKDEIIRALAENVLEHGVAVALEGAGTDVPPLPVVIRSALERIIRMGEERGVDLCRVALQTWAEAARDPVIEEIFQRTGASGRAVWSGYVERAVAAGHLPPGVDPDRAARVVIGLTAGFMTQRSFAPDLSPASYADEIGALLGASPAS